MSPWLFDVYMDSVVREVNARVLGKGLELLSAPGGGCEINQLLFADVYCLVADSDEKLWRLLSEFVRVCDRRKLRVNVGKSECWSVESVGVTISMHRVYSFFMLNVIHLVSRVLQTYIYFIFIN